MSFIGSGDEQSEDGELRTSPGDGRMKTDILDFRLVVFDIYDQQSFTSTFLNSLSEDDADTADSLDIKPPQARIPSHSVVVNRPKRPREVHEGSSSRSRHKRSERHRGPERGEDRLHSHRDKHHRDSKVSRSGRDRDIRDSSSHFRERDMYREKEVYPSSREKEVYASSREKETYTREMRYTESYKEGKYLEAQYRESRHSDSRKYMESNEGGSKRGSKDVREEGRDARYVEGVEKGRRHQQQSQQQDEKREKSAGDRALEDLRERLLNKRNFKGDEDEATYGRKERKDYRDRHNRYRGENAAEYDAALEGEAGRYVKEMINIGTGDESEGKERKRSKEVDLMKEDKLTEEEKAAQELRRLKLLEAEKEMARQKEQYRLERERKHIERAQKRKIEEQQQQQQQEEIRVSFFMFCVEIVLFHSSFLSFYLN